MNTMSPVAELPEATENANHATPDAQPDSGAPETPALVAGEQVADPAPAATVATAAVSTAGADVQSPRALLKHLQQQFVAFRNCLPLAIGIDKEVLARMPGLNRKTMRAALGIHTGSMRYLRAMEKATVRYDLDGKPGAEVTDTHRQHAKELLQERFKKEAERKKAEREAAAQEEADRKRQEKLQQLASKFAKR
jgi:ProP effector